MAIDVTDEDIHLVEVNALAIYRKRRSHFMRAGLEPADAVQAGWEGWMKAVHSHNGGKSPLEYWKLSHVRWYVGNLVNREFKRAEHINNRTSLNDDTKRVVPRLITDDGPGPEAITVRQEQHLAVRHYLERHMDTDSSLRVVYLRYFGNDDGTVMIFDEIAEHFDFGAGSARNHLHRGLERLKKMLEADGWHENTDS